MPADPAAFASLLAPLDAVQREHLDGAPRAQRLPLLAQFRREAEPKTAAALAELAGLPALDTFRPRDDAAAILPLRLLHEYQCLPIEPPAPPTAPGAAPGAPPPFDPALADLVLVTVWPPDRTMDDWVFAVAGRRARWCLGPARQISDCLTQNFGVGAGSLAGTEAAGSDGGREEEESEDENAALIRFVNEVIAKAVEDRATDIHFEPLKDSLQIRYRIDGELVPIRVPDNLVDFQGAIISRLKIMAKLNISEKRRPQDGRITYRASSGELDIRISTMPTMYGESISLRLLNQKNQPLSFEELGLSEGDRKRVERVLELPHGIVLVTGPTGSGKSTSLTAFIRTINTPGRRIITIEDPVEYEVPGVNQTQVRPEIGFTFAGALRHTLRQDPDVIMVGEIRDRETAEIAIRASLTGHLVLSTIHTNDAPGAITRLVDMEIEPFLVASSVELIIAQRLVRRLCPHCRRGHQPSAEELTAILRTLELEPKVDDLSATMYEPVGCESCRGLGFRGRVGLFEILRITEDLHDLIIRKAPAREIRDRARGMGFTTLQHSGWRHIRRGQTSLGEVLTYAHQLEEAE